MNKDFAVAYSIAEICTSCKVSKQTVYNEIARGRLRTFKVGRRRLVTPAARDEWIHLLEKLATV